MGKFNFRKVKGERQFKKWTEWVEGDYVIGKLVEVGEDQFKKANYILQVIETSLDIEVGKNLCLNANGSLDYKMEEVEIGQVVRVEYDGEGVLEKGPFKGKKFHKVSVAVAEGDFQAESNGEEDEYGL